MLGVAESLGCNSIASADRHVRRNRDVSDGSICRKQRGQERGRDEQMGGRKIVSNVKGEEKLFCQTHTCFHAWERLLPSKELGYLQMAAVTQEMEFARSPAAK